LVEWRCSGDALPEMDAASPKFSIWPLQKARGSTIDIPIWRNLAGLRRATSFCVGVRRPACGLWDGTCCLCKTATRERLCARVPTGASVLHVAAFYIWEVNSRIRVHNEPHVNWNIQFSEIKNTP
jgi:hypothetical protein